MQPDDLELHLLAEAAIERAERLVQQQELRLVDERPRDRDPLPLSAGQLVDARFSMSGSRTIESAS